MMYSNKLAVAIKSAGKVLREFNKDEVYLPFGKEYSIFIKNLNSVRALVKVTVDGIDVGDGTRFVINGNDTFDIERFIKNGNLSEGNRLKFIERTENISDHRGVGIEDGLIQVEFNFEKIWPQRIRHTFFPPQDRWDDNQRWDWYTPTPFGSAGVAGSSDDRSKMFKSDNNAGVHVNYSADISSNAAQGVTQETFTTTTNFISLSNPVDAIINTMDEVEHENDAGITVPGSISDQEFSVASWFPTETTTHTIVLKLLGETEDNRRVRKAVTVKAKQKCPTCGRVNKATAKFCTECGTSLKIV